MLDLLVTLLVMSKRQEYEKVNEMNSMPSIPLTTASHLESFLIPKEKKQIISEANSLLCNIHVEVEANSFPILNHRGLQVLQRKDTDNTNGKY